MQPAAIAVHASGVLPEALAVSVKPGEIHIVNQGKAIVRLQATTNTIRNSVPGNATLRPKKAKGVAGQQSQTDIAGNTGVDLHT